MEALRERDPRQAGPYTLIGRLGSGAMGSVYLARAADQRLIAVKIVHESLAHEDSFRERFRREIAAASRVSGGRTAAVLNADPAADPPWMAVEYVEGPSLEQQVRASGPMPGAHVFWLASGITAALVEIHRAGVTHRDLKPTNVLLSPDGPRVIDFGIARSADASTLTTTGMVAGSPAFMSPEQAVSGAVTPASDIYCLGAVLFYAATGQPVFGSGPPAAMLYRVVHNDPALQTIADPALRTLIEACLRKDPATRPSLGSILSYAGRSAGTRDPLLLAPALPVTEQLPPVMDPGQDTLLTESQNTQPVHPGQRPDEQPHEQSYASARPPWAGPPDQAALSADTRLAGPAQIRPDLGPPARRPVALIIASTLALLALIGGIAAVALLHRQDRSDRAGQPAVTGTGSPQTPATAPNPATSTASATATAAPASGGPAYLYTLATGPLASLSGTQRSYQQDGFQSSDSTSFRVGCDGTAWPTTFRTVASARRLTGDLLLDSKLAPADLVADVVLTADGKQLGHWQLSRGKDIKLSENVRGATTLELDVTAVSGSCGLATIGYGVIVDGALS